MRHAGPRGFETECAPIGLQHRRHQANSTSRGVFRAAGSCSVFDDPRPLDSFDLQTAAGGLEGALVLSTARIRRHLHHSPRTGSNAVEWPVKATLQSKCDSGHLVATWRRRETVTAPRLAPRQSGGRDHKKNCAVMNSRNRPNRRCTLYRAGGPRVPTCGWPCVSTQSGRRSKSPERLGIGAETSLPCRK